MLGHSEFGSRATGSAGGPWLELSTLTMQPLPTVLLKPGEADRILAGHPWIYHGSVLRLTQTAADGELVQVKDHRQRFLGTGFYNSRSKINVRVLSSERVEPNQAFFEEHIRTALAIRQKQAADSCRAAGDLLPARHRGAQ
jgi:23S rRNA (cytosine1962-C5)-methyltransferase